MSFDTNRPILPRLLGKTLGSPVLWANFGPLSRWLARRMPLATPPLLIVSMPRSGSNWVAGTLGMARDVAYLLEPISKSYLARHPWSVTELEVSSERTPEGYVDAAAAAFEGAPVFSNEIVVRPDQWRLAGRRRRRLIIKEVNPLALHWLAETYRPKIIFLIRHPAGVAASYSRLGWINPRVRRAFQNRFTREGLAAAAPDHARFAYSPWAEHGALQGTLMRLALECLSDHPDHRVVRYEDACNDPIGAFRSLYDFAGLEWDASVEASVLAQSEAKDPDRFASFDLYRDSRAMPGAWRSELPAQAVAELKEGFLSREQPYYRADEW